MARSLALATRNSSMPVAKQNQKHKRTRHGIEELVNCNALPCNDISGSLEPLQDEEALIRRRDENIYGNEEVDVL